MTTLAQTRDVWTPYESHGKGKGKGPPVVPEVEAYGLAMVGLCVLMVVIAWLSVDRHEPKS